MLLAIGAIRPAGSHHIWLMIVAMVVGA